MRRIFSLLAAGLLLTAVTASPTLSAGTLAGTVISSQSYGDYNDVNGNAMSRSYSNTVTVTVSQVAGVLIAPPTITSAAKNGDVIYYLVQLFNTGNEHDTQTFTYVTAADWTPTAVRMFYDINNSHSYDVGDILLTETAPGSKTYHTVNGAGTPVPISPDDDYDVLMEVTVPAVGIAPNGSSSVITVTTGSDFDNTKTATGTYTTSVLAAVIAATKTHLPAGSPTTLKPGELITYTITLTNSGSTDGTGLTLTDLLPEHLTFVPGSIKVNANGAGFVARTDGADSDGIKYDSGTRAIIAPDGGAMTLLAGQSWAVEFQATVNAGTPTGHAVTNQGSLNYTSGTSTVTVETNGDTFFVSTLAMIDLTTTAGPQTGDPGDQIVYHFHATNNGNAPDAIELAMTSTAAWTWRIWADANGDNIPGNDGDYLLTDTDADGKVDTGPLPQYGAIGLLAVTTITPGTSNGTIDHLVITATSATETTVTDSLAFTTTVRAPVLALVKALTAVQAPGGGAVCTPTNTTNGAPCVVLPGSVLTYMVTATNAGNGNAINVVLTDLIPQYTTYKSGSIQTGSSASTLTLRSDVTDADGAEYNPANTAVIVPDGGTLSLGAAGTWVFTFQVTVD